LTATWLFWIQAACQAYPLPRNLGRGAIASAIALFAAEVDDELQVKLLRRFLQLTAIVTLVVAMATMLADADVFLPRWPILVVLSLILWASTKNQDLRDWITSVHIAGADPIASHFGTGTSEFDDPAERDSELAEASPARTPWISEMIDSVRMRQKRKLARAVMHREREEASDAARLDQVLQRVSEQGTKGLSPEDQALLKRVSDTLRRNREPDEDEPGHSS